MKIKTIMRRIDNAEDFDDAVNAALEDGWHLVKRDVVTPMQPHTDTRFFHAMLYAELVKLPKEPPAPEPMTWQEAVQTIKACCVVADSCDEGDCPMYNWCEKNIPNVAGIVPPSDWVDPEESHD